MEHQVKQTGDELIRTLEHLKHGSENLFDARGGMINRRSATPRRVLPLTRQNEAVALEQSKNKVGMQARARVEQVFSNYTEKLFELKRLAKHVQERIKDIHRMDFQNRAGDMVNLLKQAQECEEYLKLLKQELRLNRIFNQEMLMMVLPLLLGYKYSELITEWVQIIMGCIFVARLLITSFDHTFSGTFVKTIDNGKELITKTSRL